MVSRCPVCSPPVFTSGRSWPDRAAVRGPQSGLDELDIERDRDFIANENAAGLETSVPGEAEVFAIDLCGRRDCNPSIAPGVFRRRRWPFDREADLAGHAMYIQIAIDCQLAIPHDADVIGFELQGRELLHIKEIGALQVRIALFITGMNRGCLDRRFNARVREIRFIQRQRSGNLRELAFHIGNHHVLDFELRDGVGGVDVPGGG
jgi:hypothetical protein